MDLGIRGKKALVCGASQGMGRAIAEALALEGAEVFLASRSKDKLTRAAADIEEKCGRPVLTEATDLSDPPSRNRLIEAIFAQFSYVDIIVHNTGGPGPTRAEDTQASEWEDGFRLLFPAVAHLNQVFLPGMKERRWGRIVAITSLSVMEPIKGLAISNAMRAAVTGMLKTLADEVAALNITVNCVAPGLIATERTEERIQGFIKERRGERKDHLDDLVASVPAKRLGTAEEFAHVVAFLCSDKASYITGSTICVDGGKRRSSF